MAYGMTASGAKARASEYQLKEEICEFGRRIWTKGFCAGNEGNHSVRLGKDRFLVTPTGVSKGFMKPDDICLVDAAGNHIAGKRKRSSEFLMHAAIYRERDDVNAVVHSHPPHATAFAVAGVDLPTCIHPEAEVFLGPVKMAKYVTPGDQRLAESIVPFVKDSNTILMGNHGVVCFDVDLERAYFKLEIVDAYARILLLARQLGTVRTLSQSDMTELINLKEKFGQNDPRIDDARHGNVTCNTNDFLSRVGGDTAAPGNCGCGQTTPSDDQPDMEQLVKTITDKIMAAV